MRSTDLGEGSVGVRFEESQVFILLNLWGLVNMDNSRQIEADVAYFWGICRFCCSLLTAGKICEEVSETELEASKSGHITLKTGGIYTRVTEVVRAAF